MEPLTHSYIDNNDDEQYFSTDRQTIAAYSLAGRCDPAHTFSDLRSPHRAKRRLNNDREKYYAYRGINRNQLGKPHYTPTSTFFPSCRHFGYDTPLPQAQVTTMTKHLLYREAQEWPRPPRRHRSDRWDRVERKGRQGPKRLRGACREVEGERVEWADVPALGRRGNDDDVLFGVPGEWRRMEMVSKGEEVCCDQRARRLVGYTFSAHAAVEAVMKSRTQRERKQEARQRRGAAGSRFKDWAVGKPLSEQRHQDEMFYLVFSDGEGEHVPDEDPREWFVARFGDFGSGDRKAEESRWSWCLDYDWFGILIEGRETVEVVREALAAYVPAQPPNDKDQRRRSWFDEDEYPEDDEYDHDSEPTSQSSNAKEQDWMILHLPRLDAQEWTSVERDDVDDAFSRIVANSELDFIHGDDSYESELEEIDGEWELVGT